MLSPEQEEQIISQALRRGLLKPEQVELHAPEHRSLADPRLQSYRSVTALLPPKSNPPQAAQTQPIAQPSASSGKPAAGRRTLPTTYGPRLDRLRKLGLLDDAAIEDIRNELRATGGAAKSDSSAAVTSDDQTSVVEAVGALFDNSPVEATGVTVRVQLPLPDALRRWTRYEITDLLGQGGMGVVYKARDRRLGRTVALKFIRLADPKMVQRFLNEARAQARITHDNICKVYEVDEVASQPYIAMEYISGQSVLGLIHKLTLEQKVRLIQDVAEALHSAHRLGIIHRDIKPQNVLVEERSDGRLRPVLMDFGLARDVRSPLNLTENGIVLGTPEYMSPEQARGTSDNSVDCRTDVYSLGAMFYELLVGHPPFEGTTSVQVLISVLNDDVIPPRIRNPNVPEALQNIVMKCLSKRPGSRYSSARELSEELSRFSAGEPVLAQPPSLLERTQQAAALSGAPVTPTARRWVVFVGCLLLTLSTLLVVGVWAWQSQTAERRFAEDRARHATLFEKDVRAMELFMRAAYGLPLHNLRSEQDQIRQQVMRIESQLAAAGPAATGPGEYALGRAAMLLNQWPAAEQHLKAALRAGHQSAQLHFALGITYGTRYQRAADEARHSPDRHFMAQRLEELEKQLLVPACSQLEQSGSLALESPAYAQALLQYHRRQFDAALASVSRAAGEAPWLPEIVQLEARLLRERAAQSNSKELMLFAEYDLKRASDILARAIDMARSNPFLYVEQAELGLLWLRQRLRAHEPSLEPYKQVVDACQKALVAQPDLSAAYSLMASAETYVSEDQLDRGEEPNQALERGLAAIAEAQRLSPDDMTQHLIANALYRIQITHQLRRGQDALPAILRAADIARDAAQRNPGKSSLELDIGRVHVLRAEYQVAHGQEPRPELEAAMEAFQRALALQPGLEAARTQLGLAALRLAQRALDRGEEPLLRLRQARESFAAVLTGAPDDAEAALGLVEAQFLEAEFRLMTGATPLELLSSAVQSAHAIVKQHPMRVAGQRTLAQARRLEAEALLAQGQDPSVALDDGLKAIAAASKLRLGDPELLALEGELHLLQARWQQRQRRPTDLELRLSQSALAASLQVNERRAASYVLLARILQAESERVPPREAATALLRGHEATTKALDIAPGTALTLLVQGELLLAQAQRAPQSERASLAEPALAALNQALKLNPYLLRAGGAARERAQALVRGPLKPSP